jgi:hypothetical protein
VHGGIHRYLSVFYSPYQLLALRPVQALVQMMTASRAADGRVTFSLDPPTQDETAALDGCRQLAVVLGALDVHYLPRILLAAHHGGVWEKEDPGFSVSQRLDLFGLSSETLAATAKALLSQASFHDPLGPWYDLVR